MDHFYISCFICIGLLFLDVWRLEKKVKSLEKRISFNKEFGRWGTANELSNYQDQ